MSQKSFVSQTHQNGPKALTRDSMNQRAPNPARPMNVYKSKRIRRNMTCNAMYVRVRCVVAVFSQIAVK